MATSTAKTNGKGKAADTKASQPGSPTTAKANPQPNGIEPTSIEEKMQRIEELKGLSGKRMLTVETLNNLKTFSFASSESAQLVIKDSEGKEFSTFNSNLIGLLTEHLRIMLEQKKAEIEAAILEYSL